MTHKKLGTGLWTLVLAGLTSLAASGANARPVSGVHAEVEKPVSGLERLLIVEEIRQRIALYGLYTDGDGPGGRQRDLHSLAFTLMTPDVVSEIHRASGGPTIILKGRDIVANSRPEIEGDRAKLIAGRHYLLSTAFDSVTATTAITRTPAVYFDATKNVVGTDCAAAGFDACGGRPMRTVMWIYEMHWRKTAEGWQIERNILRDDT